MSISETIEAWSGLILVMACISIFLASIFIWIGTKITKIKNFKFRKAIISAISSSLIIYLTIIIFSIFPYLGAIIGFFIGLLLASFLMRRILDSTLRQTFVIWIFNGLAQILAVIVGATLFIGGVRDLIKIL